MPYYLDYLFFVYLSKFKTETLVSREIIFKTMT